MKKYINILILLAIAGTVISCLLLVQHYLPGSEISSMTCGSGADNSCKALSLSGYSTIFNIPIASFGLMFYLFLLFTLAIALYAKEDYYDITTAILLPISVLAIIADIILFIILIVIQTFCTLCITTYIINILILIALYFLYKVIKENKGTGILEIIKGYASKLKTDSHVRAAVSSYLLFVLMLCFSTLSASYVLESKTKITRLSQTKINKYLYDFKNARPEYVETFQSKLVVGNPNAKLTITVFTDFLCSYCYKLYVIEDYLLKRYKDKIKFIYYNYPLDMSCNKNIKRTIYKNSCVASKAMFAASKLGIFEKYMKIHFSFYKHIKRNYTFNKAQDIFKKSGGQRIPEFKRLFNSNEIETMLKNDLELSKKNKVTATPTLFIAGKRISGIRPNEVFITIIDSELAKIEK